MQREQRRDDFITFITIFVIGTALIIVINIVFKKVPVWLNALGVVV
jgi:hypothetical protein